jgi:hypothetical protein
MMKAIRTMSMAMSNVLAFTASTASTTATAMTISTTSSSSGSSRAAAVITAPSITTTLSASASASALSMSTSTSTSTKSTNNINDNDNDNDTANSILSQDLNQLSNYHPIFIEGMGYYDPRDPTIVANNVYKSLQSHFKKNATKKNVNQNKPYLVILQGDPLHTNGISAITRRVGKLFNCSRGLICLDSNIDINHSKNADRENVIMEFNYSQLVANLNLLSSSPDDDDNVDDDNNSNSNSNNIMQQLEYSIDELIIEKNEERLNLHKPPMKDYFKQYALLQEVTKASIRKVICDNNNAAVDSAADSADSNSNSETTTNEDQNENQNNHNPITIIHTSTDINPYSVTSFYTIGIKLGLINSTTDMVSYKNYSNEDDGETLLDFDVIDTR